VDQSFLQAGKYFSRAGDKGNDLGWAHLIELSDEPKFLEQTRRAADSTDAEAQNLMGELYAHGWGVETDYLQALGYFRKAAAQGFAAGVRNIGMVYEMGWGVQRSYPTAVKYFEKAAAKNDPAAIEALGKAYQEGWGVQQDRQQAMTQYKKAAELGTLDAHNDLGWLHQYGLGVPADLGKAREYYRAAASSGNANAANNLGYMYHHGEGVEKDEKEAIKWYLQGINCGNDDSINSMGKLEAEEGIDPSEVLKTKKVVHFAYNQSDLTPDGMRNLKLLGEYLAWIGNAKVKIDGYCDARGKDDYNQKLSERRASTIKEVLLYHGVPKSMIEIKGYGAQHPVAPNDTEVNMSRNRRAEIQLEGL
jgi:TPR repeat protein